MSISVNGHSCVPPGFRFHPTEEELLGYYLRKKVTSEQIDLDVIRDVDLNKLEPWDIQEKCRIGSTPQNDWYFFSHKDKKYPTGTRTNRATAAGFWKATGRDKVIYSGVKRIGMRKTLVFYRGRAPHGQKSDWIMHEYRLDDHSDLIPQYNNSGSIGEVTNQEEGWVVCRVFKKKNLHHKAMDSPKNTSSVTNDAKAQLVPHADNREDSLDQILQYMDRSCKRESQVMTSCNDVNGVNPQYNSIIHGAHHNMRYPRPIDTVFTCGLQEMFTKLPALESPSLPSPANTFPLDHPCDDNHTSYGTQAAAIHMGDGYQQPEPAGAAGDWALLNQLLIASQVDGGSPHFTFHSSSTTGRAPEASDYQHGGCEFGDLWSLARTTAASSPSTDRVKYVSL